LITVFVKTVLYITTFIPLLVLFTIKSYPFYGYYSLFFGITGIVAFVLLILYKNYLKNKNTVQLSVGKSISKNDEILSYLVSYVFLFLNIDFLDLFDIASLTIIYLLLGIMYVNSNLIYLNPILLILGYNLYEIETGTEISILISKRNRKKVIGEYSVIKLTDNIFWDE